MPDLRGSVVAFVEVVAGRVQSLFRIREGGRLLFFLRRGFKSIRTRKDGDEEEGIFFREILPLDPETHAVPAAAEIGVFVKFEMIKAVSFDHSFTISIFRTDCNENVLKQVE